MRVKKLSPIYVHPQLQRWRDDRSTCRLLFIVGHRSSGRRNQRQNHQCRRWRRARTSPSFRIRSRGGYDDLGGWRLRHPKPCTGQLHPSFKCSGVGYRLVTVPFSLSTAQDVKEFSISMAPDTFRRTEIVEVNGDVFQGGDPPSMNEINLVASEIKETSTVLADDPFRAIQALPGVSASGYDEFFAQFSVMGAPFRHVAVYIDDVLVSRPFHDIPGESGASSSVLAR